MADGTIVIETDLDSNGLEKSLSKLGSIASKGSKIAVGAIASVTTAIGGVATASVKVGMDFESSMSQVAATMGITAQEIANGSESFELLEQAAKEAGATTQFSASQSAEALNYLALAGYDAEKAVSALPTVLNLAAAGGLDLGYASDLVTDSMASLGLETNQLEGFVDQLAKTSQKSNTSVGQLGEAILTVGGTAKVLAGGTTELNTALGILADNGIKGAEGGTALRNIILSLSAPTDVAAKQMERLGLKVLDAQGNMRPLNDIFNDLNDTLSTMTQGEQTKVLNKIFNKVDLKSVNALLSNSGEGFDELSGYIENADGAAANMAETMNDNLKGRLTELSSALEGVGIQIYEKLEGPLKNAVETAIDNIGKLSESLSNGSLSTSIGKVGESIGKFIEVLSEFISIALPAIIEGFTWLVDHGNEIATMFVSATAAVTAFKAVGVINGVIDAWKTAKSVAIAYNLAISASSSAELLLASTMSAREVIVAVLTGNMTLATGATTLWTMATNALSTAMTFLGGPIGIAVMAIAALASGIIYLWNTNEGFRNAIISAWESIKQSAIDCWDNITNFFTEIIPECIENIKEWFNDLPEYFSQLWENITTTTSEWGTNISNFFTETIPMWIESISTWFNELPYKIGEALGFALGTIYQWGIDTYNYFLTNIPLWIENISTWFSELPGKIGTWLEGCIQKVIEWGSRTYNQFQQSINYTINAISTWFSELPGKISQWLTNTINKVIQWGNDMVNKGKQAATDTVNKVTDAFTSLPEKIQQKGKEIVEGLWNGIIGAKDWLVNNIKDFCGGVVDGFKSALKINSPSKVMRDKIGVGIVEGIDVGIDKEMPNLDKNIDTTMHEMTNRMQRAINTEQVTMAGNLNLKSNHEIISKDSNGVLDILKSIYKALKDIDPNFYVDGDTLGKKIAPVIKKYNDIETNNMKRLEGVF